MNYETMRHEITHTPAGQPLAEPVTLVLYMSASGLTVEIASGTVSGYQGVELTAPDERYVDLRVEDHESDREYEAHTFFINKEEEGE